MPSTFLLVFVALIIGCGGQTIRLADGPNDRQGRLELNYGNVWGTVCDDSFDDIDARVACLTLGFGSVGRSVANLYGAGSGKILLDELHCLGTETSLFHCAHRVWAEHDCNHEEDVSISCVEPTNRTVRLVDGPSTIKGRLEVSSGGVWGTVCSDLFTDVDARVACYSLGFGYIGSAEGNTYGAGSGPIWLDDVSCTGSEIDIVNCAHSGLGTSDCSHSQDVSISCTSTATTTSTVRLVGGSSNRAGRLEVYYNYAWGTVCDDLFTDVNAKVVCNSLGFGYVGGVSGTRYGAGSGTIWLDDVQCDGSEDSIFSCAHAVWATHNCDHSEDVSISCDASTTDVPGSSDYCDVMCPCNCWWCFPADATVQTVDGRPLKMSDLAERRVEVLTVDLATLRRVYEPIITFLHVQRNVSAEFVTIETASGAKTLMTSNHLIFVTSAGADADARAVFAGQVRAGDLVYALKSGHDAHAVDGVAKATPEKVTTVSRAAIANVDIYAPLTATGTIVVDGVVASCYGTVSSHQLAHVALAPLRFGYNLASLLLPPAEQSTQQQQHLQPAAAAAAEAGGESYAAGSEGIHWYARALINTVGRLVLPTGSDACCSRGAR